MGWWQGYHQSALHRVEVMVLQSSNVVMANKHHQLRRRQRAVLAVAVAAVVASRYIHTEGGFEVARVAGAQVVIWARWLGLTCLCGYVLVPASLLFTWAMVQSRDEVFRKSSVPEFLCRRSKGTLPSADTTPNMIILLSAFLTFQPHLCRHIQQQ